MSQNPMIGALMKKTTKEKKKRKKGQRFNTGTKKEKDHVRKRFELGHHNFQQFSGMQESPKAGRRIFH